MRVVVALLSMVTLQVAEQRVLVLQARPTAEPLEGLDVLGGQPGVVAASAVPPPSANTVLVNVRESDVEALTHYLRTHYSRLWFRTFPHLDTPSAGRAAGGQCDPDECYSNCYLQGFRGGNCKENKCFCTQLPPLPPVHLNSTTTLLYS